MAVTDFWRQLDILAPTDCANVNVTLIGAGGIGSPTTLAIAKMGVSNITVYDDDCVENHNLPNQMYRFSDVGKKKVDALSDIISEYTGVTIERRAERFEKQRLSGLVVSSVDTMAARKTIWQAVKYNPAIMLYVDARMGAEVCRIHTVHPYEPLEVAWYETTLYSDDEALQLPCTARAVMYTVFVIAGLIASQVKKYVRGQALRKEIILDLVTLIQLLS